jgi:hypothetical protein
MIRDQAPVGVASFLGDAFIEWIAKPLTSCAALS